MWGDGTAVRNYTYVDDMVEGIYRNTAKVTLVNPQQCRQHPAGGQRPLAANGWGSARYGSVDDLRQDLASES